ncbi:Coiled-coil and C2 domain-containing protein 2A [Chytriomyces hyalinus]|nr:Coiled-coil and C2 domain-containing protein 2A [Chytriomyces hyalinus]
MKAKSGKNASEMTLMNAVTGESYAVKDPHLPLKVVGCVFNDMNVWANIQAHDDPPRMNWNIADIKHWKPFFHRKFPKTEYKSVQLEKLVFREVSARYCQELEAAIEKNNCSKSRRMARTSNYALEQVKITYCYNAPKIPVTQAKQTALQNP